VKVLFCDTGYSESRRRLAPLLGGWELAVAPKHEVAAHLSGVDALVPYGAQIDAAIIGAGGFGLIQQFGVGLEAVDVEAATSAGVWVARVPSALTGNADSVAEHAILLMLALSRHGPQMHESIRRRVIGEPAGLALAGKTACIIGLGGVGSALALRLQAFGMQLIGVRARPDLGPPPVVPALRVVGVAGLSAALGESDYAIVCARMDAHNHHLIDAAALSAMKQGAFLINIARGGLVDTVALDAALAAGRIAGAGLDVIEGEPIDPKAKLFRHNVIVTPHVAGVTDLSYAGIARVVADNLQRFARGEEPLHAVNSPNAPRRVKAVRS
jgi:phosphoglycerate dehydrogenase-like enzyme